MRNFIISLIMVCALGIVTSFSKNVRVTELSVPSTAVFGESVTLSCTYELGNEELYVVKWYKDDLEFYRYEPKDQNQAVYFPRPGIDIDLSKSGSNSVYLKNVALDTAGIYKCQVSTEAPTYSCVQAVKEMNVVVVPLEGPTVSGGEDAYDFGDNITLNCTSAKSKPAATINWLMNDKPLHEGEIIDHGVTKLTDELETTTKTLQLPITKNLFRDGKINIKCVASFYDRVTMMSKDVTILEINTASKIIFLDNRLILITLLIVIWPGFR